MVVVLAGLAIGSVVGGMAHRGLGPVGLPVAESVSPTTAVPRIAVHVSGRVVSPGVVEVPQGSRVIDVILAAGGATPGAELDRLNLAQEVLAGEHVDVPGPGSVEETPGADDGLVHLNSASASELETLPGVGPVLAERILAFRESKGSFASIEDLLDVPGIGEAKLAAIRDFVSVR